MGEVEKLHKQDREYQQLGMTVWELSQKLQDTEADIRRTWDAFKDSVRILHGVELKDNGVRMVLLWLIRKGVL